MLSGPSTRLSRRSYQEIATRLRKCSAAVCAAVVLDAGRPVPAPLHVLFKAVE